jgi:hypothetical protein
MMRVKSVGTEGYNGWANWETWNLYTWLSNEESLYREASRQGNEWDLEDYVADVWKMEGASPIMDAWNAYLHAVDFEEIYKTFQEDKEDEND